MNQQAGTWNLANVLTLARLLFVPVVVVFLVANIPYGYVVAIALFIIAAITDTLDGYIARSRDTVTTFGQFVDPLADKLLIAAPLIALVGMDRLPAWVAMVIIAREFAVSALRIVGLAQGVSIPADRYGKLKTFFQIAAIVSLMLPHSLFHGLDGHGRHHRRGRPRDHRRRAHRRLRRALLLQRPRPAAPAGGAELVSCRGKRGAPRLSGTPSC